MNGRQAGSGRKGDPYIQLFHSMMDSHAWSALMPAEVVVLLELRRQFNGSNNGLLDATMTTMKRPGVSSQTTLAKCLRALAALGFIENVRPGRMAQGGKTCSLYRLTDQQCLPSKKRDIHQAGCKATNEWSCWKSAKEARAAAKAARPGTSRSRAAKNTSKLQILESSAPGSGVIRSRKCSKQVSQAPDSGVCQGDSIVGKPAPPLGFLAVSQVGEEGVRKLQNLESICNLPGIGGAAAAGHGAPPMRAVGCRFGQVLRRRLRSSSIRRLRASRPVAVREALSARMVASA